MVKLTLVKKKKVVRTCHSVVRVGLQGYNIAISNSPTFDFDNHSLRPIFSTQLMIGSSQCKP